jgi:hypothetical protein
MAAYADGTLIKASGPEVDMVKYIGDRPERRWIPDPPTLNDMGLNWGAIQKISDEDWNAMAVGPPFPSRADGTLLRGSDQKIYVMLGGQRHWVPDPDTFNARGYNWGAVRQTEDDDLNAIPLGTALPTADSVHPRFPIIVSQEDSFAGSGGHMHTDVNISSSGALGAVTRTWEDTHLRGFRGAVAVAVWDQNMTAKLWVSSTQLYGVDGSLFGTSDRTDNWAAQIPQNDLPQIRKITIIQQWNPKDVFNDINAWLGGLNSLSSQLGPIVQTVSTIAAAV